MADKLKYFCKHPVLYFLYDFVHLLLRICILAAKFQESYVSTSSILVSIISEYSKICNALNLNLKKEKKNTVLILYHMLSV